jgi:hypothetical protein
MLETPALKDMLARQDPDLLSRFQNFQRLLTPLLAAGEGGADREMEYMLTLRSELPALVAERSRWLSKLNQEQAKAMSEGTDEEEEEGEEEAGARAVRVAAEAERREVRIEVLKRTLDLEVLVRAQLGETKFVTTLHMIVRGINKLRAAVGVSALDGAGRRVWRGVRGVRLPACLRYPDVAGITGALETGFISASLNQEVALASSNATEWGCPVLLEMQVCTRAFHSSLESHALSSLEFCYTILQLHYTFCKGAELKCSVLLQMQCRWAPSTQGSRSPAFRSSLTRLLIPQKYSVQRLYGVNALGH